MGNLEFIVKLIEHAAWPSVLMIGVCLLRKPIAAVLSRLATLKHGETELTFSEINKKLIEGGTTPEEKKSLASHQVMAEHYGEHGYFKLYSNGFLVQKVTIHIKAGTSTHQVMLPLAFPNELLNAQFIGNIDVKVISREIGRLDISFTPSATDRAIEVIASGV